MSNNKYDALQNRFDSSRIKVSVYCDPIGDLPEGKQLTYNRDTDTHYVDDEPWCTEEYLAHHDDAQNWRVEEVAREMQREGWSFKAGEWRCPHCTKRGE
tara:strand:- start:750 stop:1046 length:297 start_codon:yes stop_codon:yes gene_type:complete